MDVQPSKKLPHFSEYMIAEAAKMKARKRTFLTTPVLALSIVAALGVTVGLAFAMPVLAPVSWVPAGVILGGWLTFAERKVREPKTAEDRYNDEIDAVLKRYLESMEYRRLHRDLDYTAAQLLEATAYYWNKIRLQLNTPSWAGDAAPLHLRAARNQTLEAIDQAMHEQISLCVRCLALPGQKKTDFRDMIEDVIGLDVDRMLDGLRGGATVKKGYHSDHLPEIFEPARAIAERLRDLSTEIEQMSLENMRELQQTGARGSIDSVIKNLRDIQIAEAELSAETNPQQDQRL